MIPDDETVRVMEGWGLSRSLNPIRAGRYGWSGFTTIDGKYRFITVLPVNDPHSEFDDDIVFCASYPADVFRIGTEQRMKAYAEDPVTAMTSLLLGVRD